MQSRYYNPEWGRFINADAIAGFKGELLSHSMFAYCLNDPINMKDDTGFAATQAQDGGGSGSSRNTGTQVVGGKISSGNFIQRVREFIRYSNSRFKNGLNTGAKTLFNNGKVTIGGIEANAKTFSDKSVDDIGNILRNEVYDITIKNSTRSRSGAQIIQINNLGGARNISQVQVSPGGGRHGSSPYVKISTTDQGIIKIIDGPKSLYKSDGLEKSINIFLGGN